MFTVVCRLGLISLLVTMGCGSAPDQPATGASAKADIAGGHVTIDWDRYGPDEIEVTIVNQSDRAISVPATCGGLWRDTGSGTYYGDRPGETPLCNPFDAELATVEAGETRTFSWEQIPPSDAGIWELEVAAQAGSQRIEPLIADKMALGGETRLTDANDRQSFEITPMNQFSIALPPPPAADRWVSSCDEDLAFCCFGDPAENAWGVGTDMFLAGQTLELNFCEASPCTADNAVFAFTVKVSDTRTLEDTCAGTWIDDDGICHMGTPECCALRRQQQPCQRTGCNGESCSDKPDNTMTICVYRPEHACYQEHATCGRLADGSCGWSTDAAFDQCMAAIFGE